MMNSAMLELWKADWTGLDRHMNLYLCICVWWGWHECVDELDCIHPAVKSPKASWEIGHAHWLRPLSSQTFKGKNHVLDWVHQNVKIGYVYKCCNNSNPYSPNKSAEAQFKTRFIAIIVYGIRRILTLHKNSTAQAQKI